MANYVLPPPPGVENDLYEAYPQKADTVFSLPGSTITSGAQQPNISAPSSASGSTYKPTLSDAPVGINVGAAPPSSSGPISAITSLLGTNIGNITGTSGVNAIDVSGSVISGLNALGKSVTDYFERFFIILLGLVIIAAGLYLFAKDQGVSPRSLTVRLRPR